LVGFLQVLIHAHALPAPFENPSEERTTKVLYTEPDDTAVRDEGLLPQGVHETDLEEPKRIKV
jgi:hypothetical protein